MTVLSLFRLVPYNVVPYTRSHVYMHCHTSHTRLFPCIFCCSMEIHSFLHSLSLVCHFFCLLALSHIHFSSFYLVRFRSRHSFVFHIYAKNEKCFVSSKRQVYYFILIFRFSYSELHERSKCNLFLIDRQTDLFIYVYM